MLFIYLSITHYIIHTVIECLNLLKSYSTSWILEVFCLYFINIYYWLNLLISRPSCKSARAVSVSRWKYSEGTLNSDANSSQDEVVSPPVLYISASHLMKRSCSQLACRWLCDEVVDWDALISSTCWTWPEVDGGEWDSCWWDLPFAHSFLLNRGFTNTK